MPLGYLGGFQQPLFHRPSESLHNTVQPQHLPQAKGPAASSPTKGGHLHQQLRRSNLSLKEKQPHRRLGGAPARPQVTPATSASPGTRGRGGKARMLDPSRLRSHAGHSTSLLLSARARTAGFSSSHEHARASRPGHV